MIYPVLQLAEFYQSTRHRVNKFLSDPCAQSMTTEAFLALMTESEHAEWYQQELNYAPTQGSLKLREAIAEDYGLSNKQVVTFSGAQEGIFCTLNALLAAGDHVIIVKPIYESLFQLPVALGCDVSAIFLKDTPRGWELDPDDIQAAIQDNTKLIIINFPNNPTGANIAQEKLDAIIIMAREHNLYILSDEVLRDFSLREENKSSCIASVYEKGISLNAMAKSWGLGGIRVGWIGCQDHTLISNTLTMLHYLSICGDATGEYFAYIAYKNREKIVGKNRTILIRNIEYLKEVLNKHQPTLQCHLPEAGCVALLKMPTHNTDHIIEQLIQEKQMLAVPGSLYGLSSKYIRLGLGKENFPDLFDLFLEVL